MKLTESQLRVIVKQELKKVLFENVQNVEALINSFDELKYVYSSFDTSKMIKFNKGQKVGELTEPELEAIYQYIVEKGLYYPAWYLEDEKEDFNVEDLKSALGEYDITEQTDIIADALGKKASEYIHSKEEESALFSAIDKRKKEERAKRYKRLYGDNPPS